MACFVDTSALIKRYLPEARSDLYADYLNQQPLLFINPLTLLELHSALNRKLRREELSVAHHAKVLSSLQRDMIAAALQVLPMPTNVYRTATRLLETYATQALLTQDALQLAFLLECPHIVSMFVTDDQVLATFAAAFSFSVMRYS